VIYLFRPAKGKNGCSDRLCRAKEKKEKGGEIGEVSIQACRKKNDLSLADDKKKEWGEKFHS